ncbi:FACT_complex subunit spt16 [Hexamita inflata]|uniref:FACT complex subunit n=1 Tax=Hexamita inflata TaxID=28002 RepID=A0AA86NQ12_9EUKA|nr:FACT complex subunit spt16 [Hexamita inflata]
MRSIFYEQLQKLCDIPNAPDALALFQTKEFVQQHPSSPSSSIIRFLLGEEARGCFMVVYFAQKRADLAIISEKLYNTYKILQSTSSDKLAVNVYRITKTAAGATGLPDVLSHVQKTCQTMGLFPQESDYHLQSKLMQQVYDSFQQNKITHVDFTPNMNFLMSMQAVHYQSALDQSKHSLQLVQAVSEQLQIGSRFLVTPLINTKQILKQLKAPYTDVEKSATFNSFNLEREELTGFKYIAICCSNEAQVLLKQIQQLKSGLSSISSPQAAKVIVLNLTAVCQQQTFGSVSRSFVVTEQGLKSQVQKALEEIVKIHELSIQEIKQSQNSKEILQKINKIKQNASVTNSEFGVNFDFQELNMISFGGYSQGGVCVNKEVQKNNNQLVWNLQNDFTLEKDSVVNIRTTAQVTIEKEKFFVSFQDVVAPLNQEVTRAVTSPYYTRTSTSQILRDYYQIFESGKPQQQPQTQTQNKQVNDASSSSDNENEDSDVPKTQKREKKPQVSLDELKQQLLDRMLRRLPTQKLNCDSQDTMQLPTAFDSVEELPKTIGTTKHGIILGDPMFLFINGHPVPLLPQFIYQVTVTGEELFQVKIKFIAPGQIQGKKEHHLQCIQFQESTFMKELVLETSNGSLAEKIKNELLKYKTKGDKIITKQQQEQAIGLMIDPDNLMDKSIKTFLTQNEQPKIKSQYPSLDHNALSSQLLMKPRLKVKSQTGRKDFGELFVCENGFRYKFTPAGSAPIDIFIPFKQVRNIFYEKFTEKQHVSVISFQLYNQVKLQDLILDKRQANELVLDKNAYDHVSFICSQETEARLGAMGDREDVIIEKQKRNEMQKANQQVRKFFENVQKQISAYEQDSQVPGLSDYICRVRTHTKELRFQASVEQQGLQSVQSYDGDTLGCFNKKVTKAICIEDIEMAVFENVNYGPRNAFQLALIFKDVRQEAYVIRQIEFDYITSLQQFLAQKGVFYIETPDSQAWNQIRTNLNKRRDDFNAFVNEGAWISMFQVDAEQADSEEDASSNYDEESAYDADGYEEESVESAYASESGADEYDEDDEVYDWDREDS